MALGKQPDIVVAAKGALDPERRDAKQLNYSNADLAKIGSISGVAGVEGQLLSHGIGFDNRDGTAATGGITMSAAMGWTQFAMSTGKPALTISQGRAPMAGEVVLDQRTFDASGYRLGDQIEFTIAVDDQTMTKPLTLVGVADWTAGADANTWVFLDYDQLYRLVGDAGRTQLWVDLTDGADAAAVQRSIDQALPGSQAMTAQQVADLQGDSQAEAMGFLQPLLLVFAGISVVVASFLIVNTFSILVVQRTRELALLRALGASSAQLRRSVVIEALVTGLVGSVLGVLAGWGLATVLLRVMGGGAASDLQLSTSVVVSSLLLGVVGTMLASLLPAQRAAKVAPVVAMRGVTARTQQSRPKHSDAQQPPHLGRVTMRLAGLNAIRQPGRTVATAATLTIGLFLVGLLGVFGASAKASIAVMIPDAFGADFMVIGAQPIPADQVAKLRELPQVASVHPQEGTGASVGDEQTMVAAQDAADYGTSIKLTITEGRAAERANELVIVDQSAETHGWRVGDELPGVVNGESLTWQVVGIFAYPDNLASTEYLTVPETFRQAGLDQQISLVAIRLTADADLATAKTAVQQQLKQIPGATLLDIEEYNRVAGAQVDMMLNAVYALIAMSVLIATLGIINTLSLSVVERTRELGLLRAVGLTRGQLRRMVAWESLLLSVLGGAAGLGLGVLAGVVMVRQLGDTMPALAVPWSHSALALAVIVVIGVLAGLAPAIRASRTPVLHALAA